jgi:hypothetical protein
VVKVEVIVEVMVLVVEVIIVVKVEVMVVVMVEVLNSRTLLLSQSETQRLPEGSIATPSGWHSPF